MELSAGENYTVGGHYAKITNEAFSWHYNSNDVNHIQRVNGNGDCDVVWAGSNNCLPLSATPEHAIEDWRALLNINYLCNKVPGGILKRLIWCDGTDTPIGCIDVEASIATNYFTTPFFDICPDECAPLQLCVPEPKRCLHGEFVPYSITDAGLSNTILDKGMKFAYRFLYYDQRASELSDFSSLYYQNAKGCFDNSVGFPRCIKFRLPIGNPLVEKIEFYFSEDGGVTWFLSETVEKYSQYNSNQQYWYQRTLSEIVSSSYSESDCSFDYFFCNDKQRLTIDPNLLQREVNPIPRSPQGILKIKDTIAPYNYIKGSCPIDKNEASKFTISLNCEDTNDISCNTEYANVIVRAIVYNQDTQMNGFVFRLNGGAGSIDDLTDPAWFGAIEETVTGGSLNTLFDQTFTDKTRNFIPYIEATGYWGTMDQWHANKGFKSVKKVGVLAGMDKQGVVNNTYTDIVNGNFYYSEATLKVPRGTKGFLRLVSHHQTSASADANQDTSTQVIGILDDLRTYNSIHGFDIDENVKEIYFDTCNGDVELFQAFAVADFYNLHGFESISSRGYTGYITDKNNQPVEGARIFISGTTYVATTDFNGFYSFYTSAGTSAAINLDIHVEQNCSGDFTTIDTFQSQTDVGIVATVNHQILSNTYATDFYAIVKVPVNDCNNKPIAGLRVAIRGSKYKISDTNGIANFKLRNYNSRNRQALAVVMDNGNCISLDCNNNCNACLPQTNDMLLQPCFQGRPQYTLALTTLVNAIISNVNRQNLKRGGRYGFGWIPEGDCGRLGAVNEVSYFDIPRLQETGNYQNCSFDFNGNGINLPSWVNRLKIVRTVNLNPYDLQWVVDDFSRTSDGKLILTIQSLNDYNAQYFFKTNTIYKYFQGDRVEFIKNGDGKIFDTATYGLLNYLTVSPFNDEDISGVKTVDNANYFNQLIIIDDGKLDGLVKGAVIELQTPIAIPVSPTYYEICASIEVDNGQLSVQTGTFTTFDTYLVNRLINPFPAQYFENKSPSDFWGNTTTNDSVNFIDDTGKPHFVNKYENEKRYPRNISINSSTQFNYFGDLEKTFEGGQDDIIALALKDDKIGLGISLTNNFLFQVSDNQLTVGSDNLIHATSADSFISNPEAKLRGDYGCSYEDIGSILFGDGFALYADERNRAYIVHNYQLAKKTGEIITPKGIIESSCNSYFIKRMNYKANYNKTQQSPLDLIRYSTVQNKSNQVVYLTIKSLRNAGGDNTIDPYTSPNKTIMYNPINDVFLGFASFTAERYNQLDLNNETGCSFIAYQNSIPFIHPIITTAYNTFFGIFCDWVIGISLNQYPAKEKIPYALELQSETAFYALTVNTDDVDFSSEVPAVRVKNTQLGKWNFAFLNNVNSKGGLYNGSNARGYQISVLLIRDNTLNLGYGTIDNDKREMFSTLDEILIKFGINESSGMTENL